MTWPELIWYLSIIITLVVGAIAETIDPHEGNLMGCILIAFLIFLFGGLGMALNNQDAKYITTAEVEITPLSTTLSNDGLDVVTSDHQHYLFKSYDEVNRWKNGGKLYKQYQFAKVNFGPDSEKTNLIIK